MRTEDIHEVAIYIYEAICYIYISQYRRRGTTILLQPRYRPGCYLTGSELTQDDLVCWRHTAGIVQRWFQPVGQGIYLRYRKLDLVSRHRTMEKCFICTVRFAVCSSKLFFS